MTTGGLLLAGLAFAQGDALARTAIVGTQEVAVMTKVVVNTQSGEAAGANRAPQQATREALLHDLLEGDSLRQMAASQALAIYASEPEVKEALMQALEKNDNDVVRANAAKALAGDFVADRRVASLLLQAFRNDKSELVRMTIAQDLKAHTAQAEVRRAMLDALRNDRSDAVQMSASESLVAYAAEPAVREAFVNAFRTTGNAVVRANALRALTGVTPPEQSIKGDMLRIFGASRTSFERMTIAQAFGKYLDDPEVVRALIGALKSDADEGVRMSASASLAGRIESDEVYALMLDLARRDRSKLVRANALDALSARIKERPELRELFIGYLDDPSVMLQYQAVKGLVELEDPSLRSRLIERSKAIINAQLAVRQDRRTIFDTLGLLKRLDPQEAEKMLDRLTREGIRDDR
jgi:HEAT repeat protein